MLNQNTYAHAFHPGAVIDDAPQQKIAHKVATITSNDHTAASHKLLLELSGLLSKLVDSKWQRVSVKYTFTDYVIPGCLFTVTTDTGSYPFWVGVNGSRLSFVSYLSSSQIRMQEVFQTTFVEPAKIGWTFSHLAFRASQHAMTLWGSCLAHEPLIVPIENSPLIRGETLQRITPAGHFHIHELAQIAQLYLRTVEFAYIKSPDIDPGPL